MTQEKKRPQREFRAGRVAASVWKNEIERNGRTVVQWSTKIQKTYRDDASDGWKSTDYYYPSELSDLLIVTRHALDFIRLREGAQDDGEELAVQIDEASI